jgi:molecular chaperone HtpG
VYQAILAETNEVDQQKLTRNLADLALLSQGLLKGSELTEFIQRSIGLMGKH